MGEAKYVAEDSRVRGRLFSGGWISLIETNSSYRWAEPVQVGAYMIASESARVRSGDMLTSAVLHDLTKGTYIQVVEAKVVENRRVRGRLLSGGWINLIDTVSLDRWAEPVRLGEYMTVAESARVGTGERLSCDMHADLCKNTCIQIVETKYIAEDERVRGRLSSGGWISLVGTNDGYQWAQYVTP